MALTAEQAAKYQDTLSKMTDDQALALHEVERWLESRDTDFALLGGAGVGKTWLTSQIIKFLMDEGWYALVAAPTHKACRVLRSKLEAAGISWAFKPRDLESINLGTAVVDTTAALLGIRPVIDEDQTEDEVKFKKTQQGSLLKVLKASAFARGMVLVIDEVSMLGREDMLDLKDVLHASGAKLLVVGDDGQLPPVKRQAIDFAIDFTRQVTLREVVRQAKGSSIVDLAWGVRGAADGADALARVNSASLLGGDVERVEKVGGAFLAGLQLPVDDESKRSVFIAYTNKVVNYIQELACQQLYGHSATEFKAGELVISTSAGYAEVYGTYIDRQGVERPSKFPKLEQLCANADQLRVLEITEPARAHPVYGLPVRLERVDLPKGAADRVFASYYLSAEQQADVNHPFTIEKARLRDLAKALQERLKTCSTYERAAIDEQRKRAWKDYFAHTQKVLSFAHPFAITSHKSQGSTYLEAYVAVADLLAHDKRALYVAVTRPSKRLVV